MRGAGGRNPVEFFPAPRKMSWT